MIKNGEIWLCFVSSLLQIYGWLPFQHRFIYRPRFNTDIPKDWCTSARKSAWGGWLVIRVSTPSRSVKAQAGRGHQWWLSSNKIQEASLQTKQNQTSAQQHFPSRSPPCWTEPDLLLPNFHDYIVHESTDLVHNLMAGRCCFVCETITIYTITHVREFDSTHAVHNVYAGNREHMQYWFHRRDRTAQCSVLGALHTLYEFSTDKDLYTIWICG